MVPIDTTPKARRRGTSKTQTAQPTTNDRKPLSSLLSPFFAVCTAPDLTSTSHFCSQLHLHKIHTMADVAVDSATAAMEEVRLDENGQPLSKNALKKLLKAEAAAKKKAEKAAAKVR